MIFKGRSPTMRHVSRTHRVALDRLFDRLNLEPKIQTKYLDTKKNNSQTFSPKKVFSLDELNHLLCLFNIMSSRCSPVASSVFFSRSSWNAELHVKMSPRGDFTWRLSDGKAETNNSGEGEIQLGSTQHVEWGRLFTKFGVSGQSGECRWTKRSGKARVNSRRSASISEFAYSQASRQENALVAQGNSWREENIPTPTAQWSLCWVRQNQSFRTKEIHDPSIHDQDLSDPAKEVRNVSRILNYLNGSIKNKCVDMVYVHVFVDESSHSSWTELLANLKVYKNTNFEEIESLFNQYYSEVDSGTFWRNSECENAWEFISFMGEISIVSWSSDPVDKSKSTWLLRFSFSCGTDEWKQRSDSKMRRSSGRIQD